ncbi:MAG TPA: efflux RND transporter periplasmic adaptor subunit [Caldimonas sp.]|nr:efflux RND transporter periplasmic adaptor subunit [Caldimonas sp.]
MRKTSLCALLAVLVLQAPALAQQVGQHDAAAVPQVVRAQLVPRAFTTLSSETAARVDRISHRAGEHFQKGETLVEFDCVTQRAQVAKARAVLKAAEKTYAINKRLFDMKSLSGLELEVSAAEIDKAKADVAMADAMQSKCVVEAPFAGVVVDQKAREFQYTTPGQPLLEIVDDKALELEFIVPSAWLRWLKTGYAFSVAVDETGKTYHAHVELLGGRVDPVSESIKVTGTIDGDAQDLMPGMSGRVVMAPP